MEIFAINPEKISLSVKYGETSLINTVNIITSVQPFQDFIDGLAGEYVDSHKTRHKKKIKHKDIEDFQYLLR